ncbi:hypothetical protein BJX76DRAFT_362792 [Aspergillus varians]
MRMSRATTLLHLLLGLRTSTSATPPTALSLSTLHKSPATLFAQCHATNLYHTLPYASTASKPSPLAKAYATMSNPNTNSNPAQEPEAQNSKPILALPDSSTASNTTQQLDVDGDGVKLDHLGPLVVNTDGTLARISNWPQMTEIEKQNTLRIVGKRNKQRMERLKAQAKEEEEGKA